MTGKPESSRPTCGEPDLKPVFIVLPIPFLATWTTRLFFRQFPKKAVQ